MMLKEKSNQWARLKLLLLLPFGILSVYAFARIQVNESNVNESVNLFTAFESNHFFPETQEVLGLNEMKRQEQQDPVQQKQTANHPITISDGKDSSAGNNIFGGDRPPLYIVDGKETDTIEDLLPENIESISILKSHAATDHLPYGEKGKNGVVIITTKSAQSLKVDIPVNATDQNPTMRWQDSTSTQAPYVDTPLYIVDGKETCTIANISPENIESISVLKDQAAYSNYGEKGKNGVVIITLKK